jgi:hypothetical protein
MNEKCLLLIMLIPQTDDARIELPLTDKKQENYPVGIWIDTCAVHQLPWGNFNYSLFRCHKIRISIEKYINQPAKKLVYMQI